MIQFAPGLALRHVILSIGLTIVVAACTTTETLKIDNLDKVRPQGPREIFDLKVYVSKDRTRKLRKTLRLKAVLTNKLAKSVTLHFSPQDYTLVRLVNAEGAQLPIFDHRSYMDLVGDPEMIEPIVIPGQGEYELLNEVFEHEEQGAFSLSWGWNFIENIPPVTYTAKIIWRGPAISVEGMGIMSWAPGNQAWLEENSLISDKIEIALDKVLEND